MRQTTQISRRTVVAALALVLSAGSPLVAGQQTVSFNLNSPGLGGQLDGVYTSPYQATITNTSPLINLVNIPVICDDFANNSYIPEDWTAYQTTLSSINTGTDTPGDLLWNNAVSGVGGVDGYAWNLGNQETAYDVAAYLAIEIMNSSLPSTASEQLSYALWELFDATGVSSSNLTPLSDNVYSWLTTSPHIDPGTLSAATADVESAINAVCGGSPSGPNCTTTGGVTTLNNNTTVSALNGYTVNIYSVDPPPGGGPITCNGGACGSTPPQEFITVNSGGGTTTTHQSVPEPSSLASLGAYCLFGGASLLFWGRRRLLKSDS